MAAFRNRFAGNCGGCGARVAAGAGVCKRVNGVFTAFHKSCELGNGAPTPAHPYDEAGCSLCGDPEFHDGEECPTLAADRRAAPRLTVFRTSGGTFTRNARGKCEDAPCCGCCS
jgi:hypothetical protein